MQPKTCRNCSQNLKIETLLKKRLNELPSNLRELTLNSEPFIYFCNEQCFNTYITSTHQQQQPISIQLKNEPMDITSFSSLKYLSSKRQEENPNEVNFIVFVFTKNIDSFSRNDGNDGIQIYW